MSSLHNDPSLESKLTPAELDKYAEQQKQAFKDSKQKTHNFSKKNSRKLQARANRNRKKLNAKADKHAGIQRANRATDLRQQMATERANRHASEATKAGKESRDKLFKAVEKRLQTKYQRQYRVGQAGAFAAFFGLDVLSKHKQKRLDDILNDSENSPESKARDAFGVYAIDR